MKGIVIGEAGEVEGMILLKLILGIFLGILIIALLLLLLVLLLPFTYKLAMTWQGLESQGTASVSWAGGLFKGYFYWGADKGFEGRFLAFRLGGSSAKAKKKSATKEKEAEAKPKKEKKKAKKTKEKIKWHFKDIQQMIRLLKEALVSILKHIKWKHFRLWVRYGFDDPALTGLVTGICAVFYETLKRWQIYTEPAFMETCFEGELEMEGRLLVGYILWIGLKTICQQPLRSLIFRKKVKEQVKCEVA